MSEDTQSPRSVSSKSTRKEMQVSKFWLQQRKLAKIKVKAKKESFESKEECFLI